ncbi:MAG: N-acetyltransferase family protein [Erysipelotrichaceae bacterium]
MMIDRMLDNDWPEVSRIYTQAIEIGLSSVLDKCPDFDYWDAKHFKDLRFVMREDDKVVGWCALMPYSDRCAYHGVAEFSVYIDSAYQGKGIGKALLSHAIAKSEEAGIWTIFSKTFATNTASIRLQESCGFRLVGIHEKLGYNRFGVYQDIAILERRSKIVAND